MPDHLPREETVLAPGDHCADCGGRLKRLGEELEYRPGRFVVRRIVRPCLVCRRCATFHQAPLPMRPIERCRPGPGLLAHVLVVWTPPGAQVRFSFGVDVRFQGDGEGRHPCL